MGDVAHKFQSGLNLAALHRRLYQVLVYLKAYSLMLNKGCSQNIQNWNFLHIFVALL